MIVVQSCSRAVDEVGSGFIAVDMPPGLGNSGRGSQMVGTFHGYRISRVQMKLKFSSKIKSKYGDR